MKLKLTALLLLLLISQPLLAKGANEQYPPMVISISWSSPDTSYLRQHIKQWEKLPFTGTVVLATDPTSPEGGCVALPRTSNISWSVFQRDKKLTPEMLKRSAEDLRQTKFTRSKDNFLWVVTYYSYREEGKYFDWFDDARWANILYNIENLARLAKEGGLRGLGLDCEEYGSPMWSYGAEHKRPGFALKNKELYKGKSWEQVRDKVRQRGNEFIRAINKGYPGCLMWQLMAYSGIADGGEKNPYPMDPPPNFLSEVQNGLKGPFYDGMLEGSDDETIFVDGTEGSYDYSEPQEFMRKRKIITDKALAYTSVPEIYRKKVRVGFGIYLDMHNYSPSRNKYHPWYSDRPEDNYVTPARLEKAVRNALKVSDGYVWIYSEQPSWWLMGPDDRLGKNSLTRKDSAWIHPDYQRAVERAMADYRGGPEQGK